MKVILDGKYSEKSCVLALGMFDGVHIGHQVLLKRAKVLAQRKGAPVVVCTFSRHPMELLAPEKAPRLLTSLEERVELIERQGADVFCAAPFDEAMRDRLPECYVGELVRRFHPTDVVCGYNHSFGAKGAGTPALLEALGAALGFETSVVPPITLNGREISSTAIRQRLSEGDVRAARELLGRPYNLRGSLWREEGRTFFRALQPEKQQTPSGRYRCLLETGERRFPVELQGDAAGQAAILLPQRRDALEEAWDGQTREANCLFCF